MKNRHYWLLAAILLCVAIFITTASPASTGNQTKSWIVQLLPLTENQAAFLNVIFRKFVHLSAFGVLAFFFYMGLNKNRFLLAWVITTLYAATDEIHQIFIPERTGAFFDVCLDSLGAFLALCIAGLFIKRKKRIQAKQERGAG